MTLVVCVALFLAFGKFSRKETVAGSVQPAAGSARIISHRAGVVSEVHVAEADRVEQGRPIITISTDTTLPLNADSAASLSDMLSGTSDREENALAERAAAARDLHQKSMEDVRVRKAGLQTDQERLVASERLQNERVRLAEESFAAARSLHERELFATLQLRQREEAALVARQAADAIRREQSRNAALLSQLSVEEGRLQAQYRTAVAESALAAAQFDQRSAERLANRAVTVTAKTNGRVAALQARPGMPVEAGRTLALVVPEGGELRAELWVPSRAAGFLKQGAPVRLMYDAFPYQKFGVGTGSVVSVARAATSPTDLPIMVESPEPLYRVLVRLSEGSVNAYGGQWSLTPGMKLRADIVLDERSMWEWLLDPVLALRRRGA